MYTAMIRVEKYMSHGYTTAFSIYPRLRNNKENML